MDEFKPQNNEIDFKGEQLPDKEDQFEIKRRKKVILTGVFVENEADMSLGKLSGMKSGGSSGQVSKNS
jgi:hypothetical protein